jgi:2-polyprenyl-6-methoxyphenol hydroxylase-like FAD-dependent oxidoreductase
VAITQAPVLIVGAGAAGLTASCLLARHFVGDRETGLEQPRVQQSGRFSDVFGGFAACSPEPSGRYCPQSAFEPVLLAKARACGSDVRYGTELVSCEQDESGVTAVIRDLDSGATESVRAEYLVAADGVRSPVRDALAVAVDGHGALPLFAVFTYFRSPCRTLFPGLAEGNGVQILNDDVNAMIINVKDDFSMFMHTYFPESGETVDQCTPERCRELILKAVGEEIDVEIVAVAPWQPNERVARQFQVGRVSSSATRPTPCRRSKAAGRTRRSKTPTTCSGSSSPCCAGKQTRRCSPPTTPSGGRSAGSPRGSRSPVPS